MADDGTEAARVRRERDLYLRLLDLLREQEIEPFLRDALALIVEVTEARHGYLELHDDEHPGIPRYSIAHGFTPEQLEGVRAAVSGGIIAEALATGTTVVTASALADERFQTRDSVRASAIEAVLCAPIGEDPPRGVLYLQNRAGHGVFSEEDRVRAETVARHLAPLLDRVLARRRERAVTDHTASLREKLRLHDVIGRELAHVVAQQLHKAEHRLAHAPFEQLLARQAARAAHRAGETIEERVARKPTQVVFCEAALRRVRERQGITRNIAPGLASSSIQTAPSGATSTSRMRRPTSQRSAGAAPPLPSNVMRLSVCVAMPPINAEPRHCGNIAPL